MSAIAFRAWLNSSQDFSSGLALLTAHPDARPAVLGLLQRAGTGTFTAAKLVEEITRLADDAGDVPLVAMPPAAAPAPLALGDVPPEVQELVRERVQCKKEADRLHSQLLLYATDEERYQAALEIKRLYQRNDEIWSILQYREKYGHLPPVVEHVTSAADPAAQRKRLTTLRANISRDRNKPHKAEKVAAWRAEVADLERMLG